jgi:hypothetical protein
MATTWKFIQLEMCFLSIVTVYNCIYIYIYIYILAYSVLLQTWVDIIMYIVSCLRIGDTLTRCALAEAATFFVTPTLW